MPELAQIAPADAPPDIAALYADIRAVSGLPMINLIWRHFATLPGALDWAWSAVRPLVGSRELQAARSRIEAAVLLPPMTRLAVADWSAAVGDDTATARVRTVTRAYIHGNLTNLTALTALRLRLEDGATPAAEFTPADAAPPLPPLAPLPRLDRLGARLAATIRGLAAHHDNTGSGVIPSYYLELALWPKLLAALPNWLGPLYAPAALQAARESVVRAASEAAMAMLPAVRPAPSTLPAMRPALDHFTRRVIPDLIPVCVAVEGRIPEAT